MTALRLNKKLREKRKMKQQELADMLKVDRTTVTKWESGDALPRAGMLPVIATALKCKIDDLLVE